MSRAGIRSGAVAIVARTSAAGIDHFEAKTASNKQAQRNMMKEASAHTTRAIPYRYLTGKKTPGGAGTRAGHTGHTGARGHTDHTDDRRPVKRCGLARARESVGGVGFEVGS